MYAFHDKTSTDIDEVIELFTSYLENNGYRKTPERFAILKEIYGRDDHFDAEALYVHMKTSDYHVSRATVYNTLDLLDECDLILKHNFDGQVTRYEKAHGVPEHDHLICTNCGKIVEFRDDRVKDITAAIDDTSDIAVEGHALVVYGQCKDGCENTRRSLYS